jgi:choline-phosphate cytidylyltransferase
VDEVICPCPWVLTNDFLEQHKIDFVVHDEAPYAGGEGQTDIYAEIKKLGKFIPSYRTEGISTSDIITRIICDRDQYIKRNLKKGFSFKEMNI